MEDAPVERWWESAAFSRALIDAIYEASPDGILVVGRDDIVVSHNQRFLELWDISVAEVLGRGADTLVGTRDRPLLARVLARIREPERFMALVQRLYADRYGSDHSEVELTDGRTFERNSRPLWSQSGEYLGRVWFFRDISARKRIEDELRALAEKDALTGIPNRRYFFKQAARELDRARRTGAPLSAVMLDIDHFKRINDRHGHEAGDRILREIAQLLAGQLRTVDVLARTGGEEFAVLLPDTDAAAAKRAAERLRVAVERHRHRLPGDQVVTVSAGVAQVLPGEASVQHALSRADVALYRAKETGRNRTCVSGAAA